MIKKILLSLMAFSIVTNLISCESEKIHVKKYFETIELSSFGFLKHSEDGKICLKYLAKIIDFKIKLYNKFDEKIVAELQAILEKLNELQLKTLQKPNRPFKLFFTGCLENTILKKDIDKNEDVTFLMEFYCRLYRYLKKENPDLVSDLPKRRVKPTISKLDFSTVNSELRIINFVV